MKYLMHRSHFSISFLIVLLLLFCSEARSQWLDISISRSDYTLTSATFRDNQNLFVAGIIDNGAGVFHYSLSQMSWKPRFTWAGQTTTLNALASTLGQVIGVGHLDDCQCGFIITSTNNGDTWRQTMVDTVAGIDDIYFTSDRSGYFVGYNGALYATNDFGDSWDKVSAQFPKLVEDQDFTRITSASPLSLYIVSKPINGNPDIIYHSVDGGSSWVLLQDFNGERIISDLLFTDSVHGIAVGSEQTASIFQTSDGGKNWSRVYQNSGIRSINGVSRAGENTLVAVGDSGIILRSTNNGNTWALDHSPVTSVLLAIAAQGSHTAAVGVSSSVILSSTANAVKRPSSSQTPSVTIADSKIVVSNLEPDVYSIKLVDEIGRSVREARLNGPTIELNHYGIAAGFYFLELATSASSQPIRVKCHL